MFVRFHKKSLPLIGSILTLFLAPIYFPKVSVQAKSIVLASSPVHPLNPDEEVIPVPPTKSGPIKENDEKIIVEIPRKFKTQQRHSQNRKHVNLSFLKKRTIEPKMNFPELVLNTTESITNMGSGSSPIRPSHTGAIFSSLSGILLFGSK